ncbi:polysaccharide biosynthesis/export family protein [Pseudooceanicola sp. MF1-13]|uniref:polysaccharide biosynthesis/export family protein n=1 Tax=Pseudooceanicola sp. MF1-13 TaxID=3379095 RepID=UPI0038923538
MLRIVLTVILVLGAAMAQARSAYQLQPGDEVRIEVIEDESLNRTVLVLPDGTIAFPFVGSIPAAGSSVTGLQRRLADQLAPSFAIRPTIFISVKSVAEAQRPGRVVRQAPRQVAKPMAQDGFYVMGEVAKPGRVAMPAASGVTLLQGLSMVGGFTKFAATKRIELRRVVSGKEQVFLFDYHRGRGISAATPLRPGDVLVVPERRLFE